MVLRVFPAGAQGVTLDTGFNPGTGFNNRVNALAVRTDGGILVGGSYTSFNGNPQGALVRLLASGSIDPSFITGTGFAGVAQPTVRTLAVQTDDKILVGGSFTLYDGTVCNNLVRLNTDGTLDGAFQPLIENGFAVNAIAVQPDGKIVIGGSFSQIEGASRKNIARLNEDGSLDGSFAPGTGFNIDVFSMALRATGEVLVGGFFTTFNGVARSRVAQLNPNGSLDTSFDPGTGLSGAVEYINVIRLQADGQAIVGGSFTNYDGCAVSQITRLDPDGDIDPSFSTGSGFGGPGPFVNDLRLRLDGSVVVVGQFQTFDGVARNGLVLLHPDGSLDTGSDPAPGFNSVLWCLAEQPDGKFVAGGDFTTALGTARNRIARLIICTPLTWFADTDGDNLGDPASSTSACEQPPGFVADNSDCDDTDPFVNGPRTWFFDADGDTYGDPTISTTACTQPTGFVPDDDDCNDADDQLYPTAPCDDSDPRSYQDQIGTDCTCHGHPARVEVTAFLEGPFNGFDMRTDLLDAGLIPLQEPYSGLGYTFVNGGGGEITVPDELDPENDAFDVVDWVIVELRAFTFPHAVLESHACLLHRNGAITATPTGDAVEFPNSDAGDYQIAIRHRNHLPVMTLIPEGITLGEWDGAVDLTLPTTGTFGADATKNIDGTMVMWMGNTDFSDNLLYVGQGNDRDPILTRIGGGVPTNTLPGYFIEDSNLDGVVRYVGENNDRDPVLSNIGGIVPTNTRTEQLPPP
ncbi:MAG: delta-60 repeat domain-containing protein [Flavobacteriales bacterium]